MYTNADSLLNKLNELKLLLINLHTKPNVIAITEVKPKNNSNFSLGELNLHGYNLYTNDFELNAKGLLVYVDSDLPSKQILTEITIKENLTI